MSTNDPAQQIRIKCLGMDTNLFWPEGQVGRRSKENRAKKLPHSRDDFEQIVADTICNGVKDGDPCTAKQICLERALDDETVHGYPTGVRGGATAKQRYKMILKREGVL